MLFITRRATIIVGGIEYPDNELYVDNTGHHLCIIKDRILDWLKFDIEPYDGRLNKENGILEYDCIAVNTNGHIMKFKLRFPSDNVTIIRTDKQHHLAEIKANENG